MKARTIAMVAALLAVANFANAAPWAEVGDRRLRDDIELLADYGVVKGPVTSWPIPWKQIAAGIDASREQGLPGHVLAAIHRVEALMPPDGSHRRYEVGANFTNETALLRDFGDSARSNADLHVRVEHQGSDGYLSLGIGWRDDPRNGDFNFDRSYGAYALGNWVGYAGYVEQYWGPGWDQALIFSNNARPAPKIGFKRLEPTAFETPWLRWIGPWQFETFVSVIDEQREFSNHIVTGIRLTLAPLSGLEIGFTRALQLCGDGRACGLGTFKNALFPFGGKDNTGTLDEPGNQIAGIDIRYGRSFGDVSASWYGQIAGEDVTNLLITQISMLAGFSVAGNIGDDGGHWRMVAEYADTLADGTFPGPANPSSSFSNFIFTDGFTYRGRVIGAALDGDTRLSSLAGSYVDRRNWSYRMALRRANINRDGAGRHSISASAETVGMIEAEVEAPTRFGDLRTEVRLADDSPNSPGRNAGTIAIEFGWKTRF